MVYLSQQRVDKSTSEVTSLALTTQLQPVSRWDPKVLRASLPEQEAKVTGTL